jgi:hypothetical protein
LNKFKILGRQGPGSNRLSTTTREEKSTGLWHEVEYAYHSPHGQTGIRCSAVGHSQLHN